MLYQIAPRRPEANMGAWYNDVGKWAVKAAVAPIVAPTLAAAYLIKEAAPTVRGLVADTGAAVRDAAGSLRPPPPPPPGPTADAFAGGGTVSGTAGIAASNPTSSGMLSSSLPIIVGGVVAAGLVIFALVKGRKKP